MKIFVQHLAGTAGLHQAWRLEAYGVTPHLPPPPSRLVQLTPSQEANGDRFVTS